MGALIHRAAILAALLLVGCGSSDPKTLIGEGQRAIGSGDFDGARSKFSAALKSLKAGDPEFLAASLGSIEALITTDAVKARKEFIALADAWPELVGEKEYSYVGGKMISARKFFEAVEILHQGDVQFGSQSKLLMMQIDRLRQEAANDPEFLRLMSACPGY